MTLRAMRGAILRSFPDKQYAMLLCPPTRLSRASQVVEFFRSLDHLLAQVGHGRAIVSLGEVSFARVEEVRGQLASVLAARELGGGPLILWASGRVGDMAFLRSAAAAARVPARAYLTELEATEALLGEAS